MEREKRLGVLDWILLCLLLVGATLGGWLLWRRSERGESLTSWRCTLRTQQITRGDLEAYGGIPVKVGDTVKNENGTVTMGTVEAVEIKPHRVTTVREGRITRVDSTESVELWVTVRMEGILKNGEGIRVRGLRIAAGSEGNFRLGRYAAGGAMILSVEAAQ